MADTFLDDFVDLGQEHVIERYKAATEEEQLKFREQVDRLNKSYPGGIKAYVERGRKLLKDSK